MVRAHAMLASRRRFVGAGVPALTLIAEPGTTKAPHLCEAFKSASRAPNTPNLVI